MSDEVRYVYPVDPQGLGCLPNLGARDFVHGPTFAILHNFRPTGPLTTLTCSRCLIEIDHYGAIRMDPRQRLAEVIPEEAAAPA